MCRRGCQPGNNVVLPLLPPTLEALNTTTPEPLNKDGPPQDVVVVHLLERDVKQPFAPVLLDKDSPGCI
jgi:hypothetical protein